VIVLNARFHYVLRVDASIATKTAQKPRPFEMIYDPGAGTTTISRRIALDLGYKIRKSNDSVDGIGGRVTPDYTIIPDLILGGVSLGPIYAYVVEFHAGFAQRTNALLGMNVLSWFKITMDCHWDESLQRYATATLLLEPKYDIDDKIDLDKFQPLERGQRFGTVFLADRFNLTEKLSNDNTNSIVFMDK